MAVNENTQWNYARNYAGHTAAYENRMENGSRHPRLSFEDFSYKILEKKYTAAELNGVETTSNTSIPRKIAKKFIPKGTLLFSYYQQEPPKTLDNIINELFIYRNEAVPENFTISEEELYEYNKNVAMAKFLSRFAAHYVSFDFHTKKFVFCLSKENPSPKYFYATPVASHGVKTFGFEYNVAVPYITKKDMYFAYLKSGTEIPDSETSHRAENINFNLQRLISCSKASGCGSGLGNTGASYDICLKPEFAVEHEIDGIIAMAADDSFLVFNNKTKSVQPKNMMNNLQGIYEQYYEKIHGILDEDLEANIANAEENIKINPSQERDELRKYLEERNLLNVPLNEITDTKNYWYKNRYLTFNFEAYHNSKLENLQRLRQRKANMETPESLQQLDELKKVKTILDITTLLLSSDRRVDNGKDDSIVGFSEYTLDPFGHTSQTTSHFLPAPADDSLYTINSQTVNKQIIHVTPENLERFMQTHIFPKNVVMPLAYITVNGCNPLFPVSNFPDELLDIPPIGPPRVRGNNRQSVEFDENIFNMTLHIYDFLFTLNNWQVVWDSVHNILNIPSPDDIFDFYNIQFNKETGGTQKPIPKNIPYHYLKKYNQTGLGEFNDNGFINAILYKILSLTFGAEDSNKNRYKVLLLDVYNLSYTAGPIFESVGTTREESFSRLERLVRMLETKNNKIRPPVTEFGKVLIGYPSTKIQYLKAMQFTPFGKVSKPLAGGKYKKPLRFTKKNQYKRKQRRTKTSKKHPRSVALGVALKGPTVKL